MGPRGVDGLFIDFYGTLADGDRAAVEEVCRQLIRDLGLGMAAPELAELWGRRFFETIERSCHERFRTLFACECESLVATLHPLAGLIDPVPYVARLREYWRHPPLFEETRQVLALLGLPVCCVTNADREELHTALRGHGLEFACVVTSEDARCYKPHPAIFELAVARTGWRRDRILHVGDSLYSDVGGAQRCGLRTVWIRRRNRISDIGRAVPDYAYDDLLGLLELVGSLAGG